MTICVARSLLTGLQKMLLATVKIRKLTWFGHVSGHNNLAKTVFQGPMEGSRRRDRQVKY